MENTPARKKGRVSRDESVANYANALGYVKMILTPDIYWSLPTTEVSTLHHISGYFMRALVELGCVKESPDTRRHYTCTERLFEVTAEQVKEMVYCLSTGTSCIYTTPKPTINHLIAMGTDDAPEAPPEPVADDAPEQYLLTTVINGKIACVFSTPYSTLEGANQGAETFAVDHPLTTTAILRVEQVRIPNIQFTTTTRL